MRGAPRAEMLPWVPGVVREDPPPGRFGENHHYKMTQGIHLEIIFNVFLGGRQLEIIIFDSKKRRGGHDIPPKQKS